MKQDEQAIHQLMTLYFTKKHEMMGHKALSNFEWAYFFAPTIVGKRTYVLQHQMLRESIYYLQKSTVDLAYTLEHLKVRWYSFNRKKDTFYGTMRLDTTKRYQHIWREETKEQRYYQVTCVKWLGKWYIERLVGGEVEKMCGKPHATKRTNAGNGMRALTIDAIPQGYYNREKAVAYAKQYATSTTGTHWKNYAKWGGNCTNFVSQCLYAGEIPFDHAGDTILEQWYWYSDTYRTPSWTGADAFRQYALQDKKRGLVALQATMQEMEKGDVVQLMTQEKAVHTMLVVDTVYKPKSNKKIDLLIAQHSDEGGIFGYGIPLSTKANERLYIKILGYNPYYK